MLKSKSFRLMSEEEAKKQREKLYEPQECRWMKYVSIPALIGFMLLLILTNVDFTGNAYTRTATTTSITNESKHVKDILKKGNARSARTNCYAKDNCHIICSGGTIENLREEIGSLVSWCDQTLEVRLEYCKFYSGRMDSKFFTGNYRLGTLIIYDCDLAEIEANTFKQSSVADLINMTFFKTNVKTLNQQTFLGLNSLEYFKMINNKIYTTFNGVGFLEPISDTIAEVVVQQLSDDNKKYDPTNWLMSDKDQTKLLNVDLSGNIFHDSLTSATFAKLVQVQRLILSNSYITTIDLGTFDQVMETLLYLDLSNNHITTLSGAFLASNSLPGFRMELGGNAWSCDCANYELVKYIKKPENVFTVEPKCSSPPEFKDMKIKLITIDCEEEPTTAAEKLPSSTTEKVKTTTEATQTTMSTQSTVKLETTESTAPTDETTQYTESDSTDESSSMSESLETTGDTTTTLSTTTANTKSTTPPTTDATTPTTTDTTTHYPTTTTEIITSTMLTTKSTTSSQTTPTPPSIGTTSSPLYYKITCEKDPITFPALNKYDELFSIEPVSSTSVRLILNSTVQNLNLIYFTPNAKYAHIFYTNSSEYIEGLTTNVDYVFCLISHDVDEISPFNCRAQYMAASPKEAWLLHKDTALFISLSVLAVVICVICGIAVGYWTLRWRPSWLKGNKRLMKISSMPNEVLLLPKDVMERHLAKQQYILSELARMRPSMSDSLPTPVNCLDKDSYYYMQFCKYLEQSRLKEAQYFPESLPPADYAPAIPSQRLRYSATLKTKYDKDLMQQQPNRLVDHNKSDYDHKYDSVNYYEEIF